MPADGDDQDPVIEAERAHLAGSREYLRIMREDVLALNPELAAVDALDVQLLKAELWRRAEALKDIPGAPLFFGRLNYGDGSEDFKGQDFHIGRRHVHDRDGTPVVVDWRAPVSTPFYRASPADPMGVDLRRRFGFDGGELTAYEDERFDGKAGTAGTTDAAGAPDAAAAGTEGVSRLLVAEIERPRSGPMRDIVATIQPEQDDIVRADAGRSVCVQGAPGTGKTAVGLHRVAYLLYAHKEQVTRRGVVVIGPNAAFLSYIRNVLPALGELDVAQTTVTDLVAAAANGAGAKGAAAKGAAVKGTDTEMAARVKADARMAGVLRRALWSRLREPDEPVVLSRGSRRWRVPARKVGELARELRERGVRYGAGRELLGHRIAHVILTQMEESGETCDDRTHDSVRRSKPVRDAVAAAWPKTDARRLVFSLLSDPGLLAAAADGILAPAEQEAIVWSPVPRGPGSARWSRADQVLMDEAADLIERTPSLAHVVLDEAQDLSPMELRAVGRRCSTGAATVLGDVAQGTTPWATTSWEALLEHLGKPEASVRELDTGYRVPREILDYASRLLPSIAPGLRPAGSLRSDPGSLTVREVSPGELLGAVEAECRRARQAAGSVAVICADDAVPETASALWAAGLDCEILGGAGESRLVVVPVTMAKGLEYDHVVLAEPGRIAAASGETYGLRRLYVALTRAVSRLTVLHAEALPAQLCYVP